MCSVGLPVPELSTRVAIGVEYDGTHYFGWQRQVHHQTIQKVLEQAIAKVANHEILTTCAGRTDAKVHALGQVVHFDTCVDRLPRAWLRGINTYLPRDIRIKWVKTVSKDFDARQCARSRRYNYVMIKGETSSGMLRNMATWIYHDLDISRMQEGAQYLLGTHDFSAFRGANCQAKTPIRTISCIQFYQLGNKIILDVVANAFLYHMVRNMVGSLLLIGQGKYSSDWIQALLVSRDRTQAGAMAPPQGLYLLQVEYPVVFNLPSTVEDPWFLSHNLLDCSR